MEQVSIGQYTGIAERSTCCAIDIGRGCNGDRVGACVDSLYVKMIRMASPWCGQRDRHIAGAGIDHDHAIGKRIDRCIGRNRAHGQLFPHSEKAQRRAVVTQRKGCRRCRCTVRGCNRYNLAAGGILLHDAYALGSVERAGQFIADFI